MVRLHCCELPALFSPHHMKACDYVKLVSRVGAASSYNTVYSAPLEREIWDHFHSPLYMDATIFFRVLLGSHCTEVIGSSKVGLD